MFSPVFPDNKILLKFTRLSCNIIILTDVISSGFPHTEAEVASGTTGNGWSPSELRCFDGYSRSQAVWQTQDPGSMFSMDHRTVTNK
jgi:hypothetical protein